MKSGKFAPAVALAVPYLVSLLSVQTEAFHQPPPDSTWPNRGNRKGSEECVPIVAASLVFRSGEAQRIGETSSEERESGPARTRLCPYGKEKAYSAQRKQQERY